MTEHDPNAAHSDWVVADGSEHVPIALQADSLTSVVASPFVHTPIARHADSDELADDIEHVPIASHASWLAALGSVQVPCGTLSDAMTRPLVTTSAAETTPAGSVSEPVLAT